MFLGVRHGVGIFPFRCMVVCVCRSCYLFFCLQLAMVKQGQFISFMQLFVSCGVPMQLFGHMCIHNIIVFSHVWYF